MNNKNISELLNESMKSLNIKEKDLDPGKNYSIVEFCQEIMNFDDKTTIDFCNDFLLEFPVFNVKYAVLQEGPIWDKLRGAVQANASTYGERPTPVSQPGTFNVRGKVGNFFGTSQSVYRNSPMIKLTHANGKNEYLAFPELNPNEQSHIAILNKVIADQTKNGVKASMVEFDSGDRRSALANNNVRSISTPGMTSDYNKREAVSKALEALSAVIERQKDALMNPKMVISAEQEAKFKQDVQTALGNVDKVQATPEQSAQQVDPTTAAATIDKEIDNGSGSPTPIAQPAVNPQAPVPGAEAGGTQAQPASGGFMAQFSANKKDTAEERNAPVQPTPVSPAQAVGPKVILPKPTAAQAAAAAGQNLQMPAPPGSVMPNPQPEPDREPALDPRQLLDLLERAIASRASEQEWQNVFHSLRLEIRTIMVEANSLDKDWIECEPSSGTVTLVLDPGTDRGWALPYPNSRIEGGATGRLFNFGGSTRATKQVVTSLPLLERNPRGTWSLLQEGTLASK